MGIAHAMSRTTAATVRDPIASLRFALDPNLALAAVEEIWANTPYQSLVPQSVTVDRIHCGGTDRYVLHISIRTSSSETAINMLAELSTNDVSAHHAEIITKLKKSRRGQWAACDQGRAIVQIPKLDLVARPPGLDERLPGLALAYNRHLWSGLPEDMGAGPFSHSLLAHRLGKRCVVCFDGEASFIAKMSKMTSDKALWVHKTTGHISDALKRQSIVVRAPRTIRFDGQFQTSFLEAVPGTPLETNASTHAEHAMYRAGEALRHLHSIATRIGPRHDADCEISIMDRAIELPSSLFLDLASQLSATKDRVATAMRHLKETTFVTSHRDFHQKQILLSGDTVTIIDFDTVSQCDAALDIGNFLAHIHLETYQVGMPFADLETAFLRGYGLDSTESRTLAIHAYRDAALVRLAAIHACTTHGKNLATQLLRMVDS